MAVLWGSHPTASITNNIFRSRTEALFIKIMAKKKSLRNSKNPICSGLKCLLYLAASVGCGKAIAPATAQIMPDATLPVNSTITSNGNSMIIEGGTSATGNLFHSFQEFSVPTGGEAFFNNATTVENILTRITGDSISNIDGTIRANGSANLFLLNPNGIVFGTNARLNIGGSFLGTTAKSVIFENGLEFSASSPVEQDAILTVNVPIGLQFGGGTGEIAVSGPGHGLQISLLVPFNISSVPPGLGVLPGQTLALIGNNITTDGGLIGAPGGRVELAGVQQGRVLFSLADASFRYDRVDQFGDLFLDGQSLVNVSGAPSGSIRLQGRNIALENESVILSQNARADAGGLMTIRATAQFNSGQSGVGGLVVSDNVGSGRGSDLTVVAPRMRFLNGGAILQRTFGMGNSGNILIQSEDILLAGSSPFDLQRSSGFLTATFTAGNASDIRIDTNRLTVLEGASVTNSSNGVGNGGNIDIAASETIEIIGHNPMSLGSSVIGSATANRGNVGTTSIQTERLVVGSGGSLGSFTVGAGDTGNTNISATFIEVAGTGTNGQQSEITSSALLLSAPLQQLFNLPPVPSGRSGALIVDTETLRVTDGGRVGVFHEGTGDAGDFTLTADSVVLDRGGSISAETVSGQGGNLVLGTGSLLQLRNGSQITVEAGGTGDGGNLTIYADTIALLDDSRITANAIEGNGGNISIATSGIFSSANSSITASSQFGVDGLISITNPDVDSTTGLVELARSPIGEGDRIVTGCAAIAQGSSFTVVGRGGLPPNPEEQPIGDRPWADLRDLSAFRGSVSENISPDSPTTGHGPVVEANRWIKNEDGVIELVAVGRARELGFYENCVTNDR